MRQETIISTLIQRLTKRANLWVVSLLGGTIFLLPLIAGAPARLFDFLLPLALLVAHLALAPIPWQWTGDGRLRPEWGRGLVQALVFNVIWVSLALGLIHLLMQSLGAFPGPPPPMPPGEFRPRFHHPALAFGLFNLAVAMTFGWFYAEKEALETRAQKMATLLRQSQSRALQGQLKPHVLFNALNSLSELIYEDPLAAEEVLAHLADLYRMLTVHGEAELVSLGQERKLVEAYLAMEQMRLGDRLAVQWVWPSWADDLALPPLFLQPLVENAIKHGISPSDRGGAVRISLSAEGSAYLLQVANTGKGVQPSETEGIGLKNLNARLELWQGAEGRFSLSHAEGWTTATVRWTLGRTS